MYQHLHTPLAVGGLDQMPQPVVVLPQALLEKTRAAISEPSRASEGDTDDNRRYRRTA
jgi:hypothetical protein